LKEKALEIIVERFEVISQQTHIHEMRAELLADIIQTVGRAQYFNEKEKW